jgi:hypothetical protein
MNDFEKVMAQLIKPEIDTGGVVTQMVTPRITDTVTMTSRIRIYDHPAAYTYSFADYTTGTLVANQTGVFTTSALQWFTKLLLAHYKTDTGQNKKGLGALRLLNGSTTIQDIATPIDHQRIVNYTTYATIFELTGAQPATQPATINKIQIFRHGTTTPVYSEISFSNITKTTAKKFICEFATVIS